MIDANPDTAIMFAVRVDPAVFPLVADPAIKDEFAAMVSQCIPFQARTVSWTIEPGGVVRFRGQIPLEYRRDLTLREQWLRSITMAGQAFFETRAAEIAELRRGASVCNIRPEGAALPEPSSRPA